MKKAMLRILPSLLVLLAGCSRTPRVVGIWASADVTSAASGARDTLVLAKGGGAAFRRFGAVSDTSGNVQPREHTAFGEWKIDTPGEGTQRLCLRDDRAPQQAECADVTVSGDTLRWRDVATTRETVFLRVR